MSSPNLLRHVGDVSEYSALTLKEREALLSAVLGELGSSWSTASRSLQALNALPLLHLPTQLSFVLIPGGSMQMGLLDAEYSLLEDYLGSNEQVRTELEEIRQRATPVRTVEVAPFICGLELLSQERVVRLYPDLGTGPCGELVREEALALAQHCGFRLPTDAELEWLARVGQNAMFVEEVAYEGDEEEDEDLIELGGVASPLFGIEDLFEPQWAADDWFPNHRGAPSTSAARQGGDPQGVRRFEEIWFEEVGREAVLSQLSARREPGLGRKGRVRLATGFTELVKA